MGCCWNSGNDSLGNHKGDRNFDRQSSIKPCKLYLVLVRLNNNKMVVTNAFVHRELCDLAWRGGIRRGRRKPGFVDGCLGAVRE